jgi:hypothetical protein
MSQQNIALIILIGLFVGLMFACMWLVRALQELREDIHAVDTFVFPKLANQGGDIQAILREIRHVRDDMDIQVHHLVYDAVREAIQAYPTEEEPGQFLYPATARLEMLMDAYDRQASAHLGIWQGNDPG